MATPEDAIAAVHELNGFHPGKRALHAKGALYRGTFTATSAARQLTRAAHLDGRTVRAIVRFSNGSGDPANPDTAPMVRGMAVKFTLPDGSTTDISSQTGRLFISKTPDGFVDFVRASKPGLTTGFKLAQFSIGHPEFLRTLRANASSLRAPSSYATVEWHALHAFEWIDADGASTFVRYHWLPEAGVELLPLLEMRSKDPNFLEAELAERLAAGPVRYDLHIQIAGPTDSTVDPSAAWASDATTHVGTLEILGPETEREHNGDVVVFDPMRITDGIKPSDDPVLHFRTYAYSVSVKERTGIDRGAEAP